MMKLNVSIVVGNPKPQSRTLAVAESLISNLLEPSAHNVEVIDLATYADEILVWPSDRMAALNARVAESDVVVFASPTYKATYTGLLKAFLDRYPANGLAGVVAIPILTGGGRDHSMGPTVNLAPLLLELGAIIPGKGFYFSMDQMSQLDETTRLAAEEYAANLLKLASVGGALPGLTGA